MAMQYVEVKKSHIELFILENVFCLLESKFDVSCIEIHMN